MSTQVENYLLFFYLQKKNVLIDVFLGRQPLTSDTAKKIGDLQTKAQLAMQAKENGREVSVKDREAIDELEAKTRMNHFGVGAEGFQVLRQIPDSANWKRNPITGKPVPWDFCFHISDSQSRYLPWFLLVAKMHKRYKMPVPKLPVPNPALTKEQQAEQMVKCEEEYLEQMLGDQRQFLKALADEMVEDSNQLEYMVRTFFKNFVEQGQGVLGE